MTKALVFGFVIAVLIGGAFIVFPRLSPAPSDNLPLIATGMLKLISPAFSEGGMIPSEYTCDGANVSPALNIEGAPAGAKSFALMVDDPDSPRGAFTHWLMWNISPTTTVIEKGITPVGAVLGQNDFGRLGYGGPCPGTGTHQYVFKLYTLDSILNLPSGASLTQFKAALEGHVLKQAVLMGKYQRKR